MLFTADWHLGLDSDSIPSEIVLCGIRLSLPSKVVDTIKCITELIDYAAKEGDDIFHGGDIFEVPDPESYVHYIFSLLLQYAYDKGVRIIFISGNHDCNIKWSALSGYSVAIKNILFEFITTPALIRSKDNKTVLLIPHAPKSTICGDKASYLKSIKEKFSNAAKVDVVVTHALVTEALSNGLSVSSETNDAFEFNKSDFVNAPLYVVGHNHSNKLITKGKYKIVIPGSIVMNDFGEVGDKKGFYEYKNEELKFITFKAKVSKYLQINLDLVKSKYADDINSFILRLIPNNLIKLVITVSEHGDTRERELKDRILKCGSRVVRTEIKRIKTTHIKIKSAEIKKRVVVSKKAPYSKLLSDWLDTQEYDAGIKAIAIKMGEEIIRTCLKK